jgi:hypothetical protein
MGIDQQGGVTAKKRRVGRPRIGRSTETVSLSLPADLVVRFRDRAYDCHVGASALATALLRYGLTRLSAEDLDAIVERDRN